MEPLLPQTNRRAQGAIFEQKARDFLAQQGLTLIAQNQCFRCGELDLIMQEQETIVFVEVRQRQQASFGSAAETINKSKQQKWLKAANLWLALRNQSLDTADCRFDVVAFDGKSEPQWIKNFLG